MNIEATDIMGDSSHVILAFIKAQESDSGKPTTILLLKNIPEVLRQVGLYIWSENNQFLSYYELNVSPDQIFNQNQR